MLVVVTRSLPGDVLDRLRREAEVWVWEEDRSVPVDLLRTQVGGAGALLCMLTETVDEALLERAQLLRVVSQMAVGVDNIDLAACTVRRIPVGHTPDVLTETTADTAMALLLSSVRRIVEGADFVRAGRWQRWDPDLLLGGDLGGTTLGIVGLGRIGTAVARRAAGFSVRILYTGPQRKPGAERQVGATYVSFDELLRESDHVVVTAPLTPATRHLIDDRALELMKPTATLVNVSRGLLVDTGALVTALAMRTIAAAALDVTDPEPLPADHALLALPNCLVVPHLGSSSVRTRMAMAALAVDNVLAGLAGRPLPACANPEVYDEPPSR